MRNSLFVFFFALLVFPIKANAQSLRDYKYVIVPKTYKFTGEEDKYQLNSMTVYLFEKHGFEAIMAGDSLPADLMENPCLALNVEVNNQNTGMFSFNRKIQVVLKNCHQKKIFESIVGKSRVKDFKLSYQEALRNAFSSIDSLNHVYEPTKSIPEKQVLPKEKPSISKNKANTYFFDGREYMLVEKNGTWVLKAKETNFTQAHLYKTKGESFVFRSETINGTAYFDENGNLVVEYFDEASGGLRKITYKRQNQKP